MSKDFTATIKSESPRAEAWERVFGSYEIALRSPLPELASAPGVEAGLFYQLDSEELTEAQRSRLIHYIANRFHINPEEVAEVGCPILAEDVMITIFHPQRWI